MIGYIYRITNIENNKCYVGITKNFNQRKKRHIFELSAGAHHSSKLQNAWDYYGAEKFEFSVREVEVQEYDDLYKLEIEEIQKYNSFEDGYNCNSGGGISDWRQIVSNDDVIRFLCFRDYYGTGYGKTFEEVFNWARGTASRIERHLSYPIAICDFEKLSNEEKKRIAEETLKNYPIEQTKNARLLAQGGCQKAYTLTPEDYNFAFCAQELGYGYTVVANYLEIKPATVKDWFGGKSRKKEKERYDKLSTEEKNAMKARVESSGLIWLMKDKFVKKNEDDMLDFLCYDEIEGDIEDATIERLYGWSSSTIHHARQEEHYQISKKKVSLMSQEEKKKRIDRLIGRVKIAELSGKPKS